MITEITPELLSQMLTYNKDTGKLFWKRRTPEIDSRDKFRNMFNTRFAGKEALAYVDCKGYAVGNIADKQLSAHRVAWALEYGEWPNGDIDHINGNRSDNRIENLRVVCKAENNRNMRKPKTNTSGVVGVSFDKKSKKWHSYIHVNNKRKTLGYFADFDGAVNARKCAEQELNYHPNHGRAA